MSCNQEDVKNMKALIKEIGLEKDANFIAKGCNENYKTCKSCTWGDYDKGGSYDFDLGNIYYISIYGYLKGKIPTSLTKFNNINGLDLSNNNFKGDLPLELNQFKGLYSLTLYLNQIDNIPIDKFPNLYKSLGSLSLFNNNFKGELPKSLNQFNNLTNLNIGGYLNSIPNTGIENLKNLISLDLEENYFTGEMPVELNQFSNLTSLYFGDNNITSIPSNKLYNLKGLTYLRAVNNCISFTPQTADAFKDNFKNAIDNYIYMDFNCISKGQYGFKGIAYTNCGECNYCPLAKQKVIDKINIQNSHLTISYAQYNEGLCPKEE